MLTPILLVWLLVRREVLDELFVAALHLGARVLESRLIALEDQPGERPDVGDRRLLWLRRHRGRRGGTSGVLPIPPAVVNPLRLRHNSSSSSA